MEYRSTSNTVYACQYHVVFCPKYRRKVLVGEVRERFMELAHEAIAGMPGVEILEMEVMPDHVHMLLEVPPDIAVKQAIGRIKGATSRILRAEFPTLKSRIPTLWTNSCFVSSVGGAPLGIVEEYIKSQRTSQRKSQDGRMG